MTAKGDMREVSPFDPDYVEDHCSGCGSVERTYEGLCYYCWFARFGHCAVCGRLAGWHRCEHMEQHFGTITGASTWTQKEQR